ncbi:MAG: amino acid adenylation domain-containing protein, partial [Ignavibacteriae bacterium]|nr:amino acid adenylation domain-containing protein [Ignavibacteriota bacterium]
MENIQDIYPLTPMQEGMLFHTIYSPESEVYKEQFSCKLIGEFELESFKSAWDIIINRHDILRTAFIWEDVDEPLQIVHSEVDLPFIYKDISHFDTKEQNSFIEENIKKKVKEIFNFAEAPLMRISLFKLCETKYFLIWDHHHILFDGWGLPVLMQELMVSYNSLKNGIPLNLSPTFPFKNYIGWLKSQDQEKAKLFWNNRLSGFTTPTKIQLPFKIEPKEGYSNEKKLLYEATSSKLLKITKEEQLTTNTIIQAAWSLVLAYYTNSDDVVFGATVSGRNANVPGIESMVGLFINTLPVRAKINFEKNILEWLKEFQIEQSSLQEYEYSPLFKIQNWSDIPKGEPLFNSILVLENYPVGEALEESNSVLEITDVQSVEKTNYPLTVVVSPGKLLGIEIAYDTNEFDSYGIDQLLTRLSIVIENLVNNISRPIHTLDYLTKDEVKSLPNLASGELNRDVKYNNVIEWFEQIVNEYGSFDAVVTDDGKISFQELNIKSNKIADYLLESNITSESIIGICLDRSIDMVSTIIAINKIGAAALPIDSNYPEERIKYIIEDSNLSLLLTTSLISEKLNVEKSLIIDVVELNNKLESYSEKNVNVKIHKNNLSYIIYTSGSTGKPKGVCLEHYSLCNFVNSTIIDFGYNLHEKVLQFSSFGFDAAIGEIFSSLLSASTLFIPNREVTLSGEDLIKYVNSNEITFTYLPPSYLSIVDPSMFHSSLKIAAVGDKCTTTLAEKWGSKLEFYNGYGPTETTIGATFYKYISSEKESLSVPIGKGFGNVKIYLLDKYFKSVSIGVRGEIFIAGDGVGRGYLNRSDVTSEKYIPDLFSNEPGKRMYRTGDLGMLLPDGNVEFIGRADFQVKLRGYRIELNEIESVLHKYEAVKDCAVTAIKEKDGNEYLAGYVILEGETKDVEILLDFMRSELPTFMIPKSITFMDTFPLTPNKKIDRKKLPKPDTKNIIDEFIAPQTPTEEVIANIWMDILDIEVVSRTSNFFELGGHSLLATQLISRLRETFKKEIPFQTVFESKNLKELANRIDNEQLDIIDDNLRIEKADRNINLPVSYSQQRLWFLDQLKPDDPSYNIPTAIRLQGDVKPEFIEEALNLIINKHEILRTSFKQVAGKPYQDIADELKISIEVTDVIGNSNDNKIDEIKKIIKQKSLIPFNLSELPLLKCELLKIDDNNFVFLVVMHHIISDGWSLSLIIKEFVEIYTAVQKGTKPKIKELEIQYADFALWQQNHFETDEFKNQLKYWREELAEAPPMLELPYDKPKPNVQTNNSGQVEIAIKAETVSKLNVLSRSENATLFITLLSSFQLLLSKYSNSSDVVVGTPIAGRNNSQIENLVGFFVNNLAIRAKIDRKETFRDFLILVRDTTLSAYANQSLPFDKIVEELQPVRDLSHQPIFQVMFVFQNIPSADGNIEELTVLPFEMESQTTNFDLSFTLQENQDEVFGAIDFNTDLFEESTIERLVEHFNILLEKITKDPDIEIGDIVLLSNTEENLIFNEWKNKNVISIKENVIQRFENVVTNSANLDALVFKTNEENERSTSLNYSELNSKSNQLAHHLVNEGVRIEDRIAICMERHENMIISMLSILKAGGAFVPIDPSLPLDRIKYMLDQVNCKKIIVNNTSNKIFDSLEIETINLDEKKNELESFDQTNLNLDINLDNLAYVIFTSGSTGVPKGVMLNHKGLTNLSIVQKDAFSISSDKKVMQFSSLSFDASVWETVMALLNGASLYLTRKEIITSGHELSKFMIDNEITTITLPPSVLAVLPDIPMPKLKTLITAGESVSNELANKWSVNRKYFNAYGPTETTVCATMYNPEKDYPKGPPIGKAIPNFEMFILDSELFPVGIGIPGELCVGGIGLARGYINQPDLTSERFIPNAFTDKNGERLYRTGDLAKYLPDGNIEFLGRVDSQVKLRGFRIEIGEIEHNLKQIEFVDDAVVILKKLRKNQEKLIGYVVCSNESFNKENIISSLKDKLPEYMIPTVF